MYKEYSPCSLLAPFIDRYWEYKGETRSGMKFNIPPHGCSDFVFNVGNATDCTSSDLIMRPYHSYFFGPMNTFTELVTQKNFIHIIGVRFQPCGLSRFIKIPLSQFMNQGLDSHEFPALFSQSFIYQLSENQNPIGCIEHELVRQLYKNSMGTEKQISHVVSLIRRQKGIVSIKELATEVCLCLRQFERKFKFYTGYSPKEYSRIVQFWNAIHLLKPNTSFNNLLFVAIQAGYYDASHLYREVKRFSGHTPKAFLTLPMKEKVEVLHFECIEINRKDKVYERIN
ncbi:AraC family transcriptional regulator [Parabacteroides distasonis]|uniref:AraC family transcriptional regulator n=2 Tax=Bacteroidales TaxID=171549 RepID=A0A2V1IS86_9BACT|nr:MULTISPECIES: helix-turn-helix domain-containing protein [Bacteroidales]MBS5529069.1 AraC family transcriptional regulator [Prevotella sp.]NPD53516.1 AraC family transcriptional regulator [Prevotella sp. PTAC]NUK98707.1 AraC family transcriptional regulator [Phocaeicola sartorii]PWB03148.1 AraC family transcriptional regulator [Duncaniella muris]QJE28834.1 AraC family transcriptional regulator [Parabacteroides distasonis]